MSKEPRGVFVEHSKEPVIERIFKLIERYPSRSAAARAWNINVNTLKNYYRRQDIAPTPRHSQLLKIAEVEGVSLDWLLHGTGAGPEPEKKSQERTIPNNVDKTLMEMLSFLSEEEKRGLVEVVARKGVEIVLYLLDEDNIDLLRMDPIVKEKILGRQPDPVQEAALNVQEKRERDTDGELQTAEHDLANITKKKQAR
ncbi:hypothetical protein CO704_12200 [Cedecea neteri]|uniref:Regulatory protein n=1 Tax=Cedecea neteri TaxID=158822 RepID=A0A291E5K4_9ENTR|nr:hypothetical protein CO704_12200 [Cedecea neteri]